MKKEINPKIFKAYDVRGIYPHEISQAAAEIVARAFVKFLKKSGNKNKKLNIVIGRDNRLSSPLLFQALKKGILSQGVNIIDIGLSSTPMFYFSVWKFNYDGGIQITASHNPPKYNGFKIVRKRGKIVGENSGLKEVKKITLKELEKKEKLENGKPSFKGKVKKKNILKDYIKFNLKDLNVKNTKHFKLVIDTGNAVSGILIRELKKNLCCKICHLFPKLDGSFPNHGLNPLEKENIKDLKKAVKKKKADLGMAFDGDGDRVVFIDENGRTILSDSITCLMSELLLRNNSGAKILYNVCSSNTIVEVVKENNGVPIATKIGHTFVKEIMEKENGLFAGESSGHFYFKSHHFCEAPLLVLFEILKAMFRSEKPISQLLISFQRRFHSGQINLKVKDKKRVQEILEKKYKKGKISHIDGLRVDFQDWWFNARPSNTEDLLRLVVEAENKDVMRKRLREIRKIIKRN